MPPVRKIFADATKILRSIYSATEGQIPSLQSAIVEAQAEMKRLSKDRDAGLIESSDYFKASGETQLRLFAHERDLRDAKSGWIRSDLELFADRVLSESEKQTWRKAIRNLEAAGLIQRDGRHVRLSDDGLNRCRTNLENPPC